MFFRRTPAALSFLAWRQRWGIIAVTHNMPGAFVELRRADHNARGALVMDDAGRVAASIRAIPCR